MKIINELKAQAAGILKQMRGLVEKAETEKRNLSAEETASYDKMEADYNGLRTRADRMEKLALVESEASRSAVEPVRPEAAAAPETRENKEYRDGFRSYLRGELSAAETRALAAGSTAEGGALVLPMDLAKELIKAVDDLVFVRRFATKHPMLKAASLGVPAIDSDPADADWTSEVLTGDEDTTMDFAQRELSPLPLAKRIKVSNKLLRMAPEVERIVMERLAYKFAVSEEKAFLTGSGSGAPLGLFTASSSGINTDRDVSTGNTATAITFDGLKEAKYALNGGYWAKAAWIFHRSALKMIAKLKDGEGRYIWEGSLQVGEPDRLLGFPVYMSEYAPSTFTTGLYVGIVGDLSQYHIADSLDMSVQRLNELYAATNQTGFIGRLETDGLPALPAAFARVKLG